MSSSVFLNLGLSAQPSCAFDLAVVGLYWEICLFKIGLKLRPQALGPNPEPLTLDPKPYTLS